MTKPADEEPWAYAVFQAAGAEFDYVIYPNREDAENDSQVVDEGVEPIPLYPRAAPPRQPGEMVSVPKAALDLLADVHRGWCNYCHGTLGVCRNAPEGGCALHDLLSASQGQG